MRFSIITVTYNDFENLKITLNSVKNQKFKDFEYIIIDGGSTDGTIEYFDKFSQDEFNIKFFTGKDEGIYDAMNKGVLKANGEYIIFLGASDTFYSDNILEEVNDIFDKNKTDILYGKVIFSSGENKGKEFGGKLNFFGILLDQYVAHQSVFAKRDLLEMYPFDLNYKFLSDQDFMLNVKEHKYKMKYLNIVISYYDGMGFSSDISKRREILNERIRLLKNHNRLIYYIRQIGHYIKNREFYKI